MSKKIGLVVALIIIVFGFFVSNLLSHQKDPVKRMPSKPNVSNYKFQTIKNKVENFDIKLSGNLKSYNELTLFTEVTGVAKTGKVEFREGAKFKKGSVLLKIDDTEYKNSVYAQKSLFMNKLTLLIPDLKLDFPSSAKKWQNYLNNFDIEKKLMPLPKVSDEKEKYYITSKNIYNQYYSIKSMETRLAKYKIIAPFDGVITSSMIKPGTLVRAGQQIGVFKNTGLFEMTAFANIEEVQMLNIGMPVKLVNSDINEEFIGEISRINQSLDKASQKVKVYILLENNKLIDGLYFNAIIGVRTKNALSKIPSEAVFNSGSVWLNVNGKFISQRLRVVHREDEFVYVEGLKNGQNLLLNPDKNVEEGKIITINNPQKKGKK